LTCARLIVKLYYIFTYSTYITGGGGGGLGNPALSSIDEAYHFYAMRDPLEPEGSRGKIIRIIRKNSICIAVLQTHITVTVDEKFIEVTKNFN
jgi:hypothetical protein